MLHRFKISFISFIKITMITFIYVSIIYVISHIFMGDLTLPDIFTIIDSYIKIILSSWPASILIISLFIFNKYYESISYFIKNRMVEVGASGVKGSLVVKDASSSEIRNQKIKDIKEEDKTSSTNNNFLVDTQGVSTKKNTYNLNSRVEKISQIENATHVYISNLYPDQYKPEVKIEKEGKSIILDGVLYGKKNKSKIRSAIEIRYMSSKRYESLRFIIARRAKKIAGFGINKIKVILVGDNITSSEALSIYNENMHQAQVYFYNWDSEASELIEVKVEERKNDSFAAR